MTTTSYTYETIIQALPQEVKDRYDFDHHTQIKNIRVMSKPSPSSNRYVFTLPIEDIYDVSSGEVATYIRSDKFVLTLFKNLDYMYIQIF